METKTKIDLIVAALSIIILLTCFAMIGIGSNMMIDAGDINSIPYFEERNCTPILSQVAYLQNCYITDTTNTDHFKSVWFAIWKDKETGYTIIDNPFEGKSEKNIAERSLLEYELDSVYPCMCLNNSALFPNIQNYKKCQVWNTCCFDVDLIKERQDNSNLEFYKGKILLYLGISCMTIYIIVLILFCVIKQNCDCNKNKYLELK